jgi:phosphoglycolate phosphatase-like HAD superfamily hydrolase
MAKLSALISDADGTLIDSVELVRQGLYETARSYLSNHGVPTADIPGYEEYQKEVVASIGGSARESLERIMARLYARAPHHLAGVDYDALNALLDPIQDKLVGKLLRSYAGLSGLLSALGRESLKLAIVTSGTRYQVVRNFGVALPEIGCADLYLTKHVGLEAKLGLLERAIETAYGIPQVAVITCEQVKAGKPDPAGMRLAMKRLRVEADACAVVGDHDVDMQAGLAAGIPVRVGVTHGFGDSRALTAGGATGIVSNLSELPGALGIQAGFGI